MNLLIFAENQYLQRRISGPGQFTIGRAPECDICIDHPTISRQHAVLRVDAQNNTIEDLASFNGVQVGGTRIASHQPTVIYPGMVVELGSASIVFQHITRPDLIPPGEALPSAAQAASAAVAGGGDRLSSQPIAVTGTMLHGRDPLLARIAQSCENVLILGETGVGKEVLARHLHALSARAAQPFCPLNCAEFPEQMLEGELFGYERGAFTGADKAKPGLLDAAHKGTVLLDEIGDLSAQLQLKLLRFVQHREVKRLGSLSPRTVDVRVIAATHRQLSGDRPYNNFRADLFFRLACIPIWVPPLRQRQDEIQPLAQRFVADASHHSGRQPMLSPEALQVLLSYSWPGNIRELETIIRRAVLLSTGPYIGPDGLGLKSGVSHGVAGVPGPFPGAAKPSYSLPNQPTDPAVAASPPFPWAAGPSVATPPPAPLRATVPPVEPASPGSLPAPGRAVPAATLRDSVNETEHQLILRALSEAGGNQSRAAARLGIARNTLISRMRKYEIVRPRAAREDDPDEP